jgi:chemotaxis protein methyltransferase CheR
MNLLENDFKLFRDYIYELTGMHFPDNKKYIIERRLEKRMEDLGCDSIKDYYRLLKADSRGSEIVNLINIMTTNETYFHRNLPQLKILSDEIFPVLIKEKIARNDKFIKIWSAACSTGEEPYTLSMLLLENLPNPSGWNIQILASDINRNVLNAARRGVYSTRSVKDVPPDHIKKYFLPTNGSFEVKPQVKQFVRYFSMNLVDEKQMSTVRGVDIVFCRNVLIYFDDVSRKKTVGLLYDSMKKGGYIFLGHSESLSRISTSFKICKFKNGIVYRKD